MSYLRIHEDLAMRKAAVAVLSIACLAGCNGGRGTSGSRATGTSSAPATAGSGTTTSAPTRATGTNPSPGKLVVVSPLTLDKKTVGSGDTLSATVTYANAGGTAITVAQARIVGVPPVSVPLAPFVSLGTTTVAPG